MTKPPAKTIFCPAPLNYLAVRKKDIITKDDIRICNRPHTRNGSKYCSRKCHSAATWFIFDMGCRAIDDLDWLQCKICHTWFPSDTRTPGSPPRCCSERCANIARSLSRKGLIPEKPQIIKKQNKDENILYDLGIYRPKPGEINRRKRCIKNNEQCANYHLCLEVEFKEKLCNCQGYKKPTPIISNGRYQSYLGGIASGRLRLVVLG